MPTNPKLQLEAIVDFVLRAGKVEDKHVVDAIRRSLRDLKVQDIDLTPTLRLDEPALRKDLVKQIGTIEKALDKSLENFDDRFRAAARKRAAETGQAIDDDKIEAASKAALKHIEEVRAAFRDVAKQAGRLADTKVITSDNKSLQKSLDLIKQIQGGQKSLADLSKTELSSAEKAVALLRQRSAQFKDLEKTAGRLNRIVTGPEVTPIGGGEPVNRLIPAAPLLLPDVGARAKQLSDLASGIETALDPNKAQKYEEALKDIDRVLGGTKELWRGLNKEVSKLQKTDLFGDASKGLENLKSGVDDLRKKLRQVDKIEDFTQRSRAAQILGKESLAVEKKIGNFRSDLEKNVARQRNLEVGRFLKNFGSLVRSPVAQAEAEIGRVFLKGFDAPEIAIRGLEGPRGIEQGKTIVEALKQQVIQSADALQQYTNKVGSASAATDKTFVDLHGKLLANSQELINAEQKVKDLVQAETPRGRRTAADEQAKLEIVSRDQAERLRGVGLALDSVNTKLKESGLAGEGLDRLNSKMKGLRDTARSIGEDLAVSSVMGDPAERRTAQAQINSFLSGVDKGVKRLSNTIKSEAKQNVKVFQDTFTQAQVRAGETVLTKFGEREGLIEGVRSVEDMSNAVAALDQRQKDAEDSWKRYANEVDKEGVTERFRTLQERTEALTTSLDGANKQLGRMRSDETVQGFNSLNNSVNKLATSADSKFISIDKSLTRLVGGLGKLDASTTGLTNLVDQADASRESLERLRNQAVATLADDRSDLRTREAAINRIIDESKELQNAVNATAVDLDKIAQRQATSARRFQEEEARIAAGERPQVEEERRVRGEAALAEAGRDAPAAIPPLVFAAQQIDLASQVDALQALRSEQKAVGDQIEEVRRRRSTDSKEHVGQVKDLSDRYDQLGGAIQDLERRGSQSASERSRAQVDNLRQVEAAQRAAAKRVSEVDPQVFESLKRGAQQSIQALEGGITDVDGKMRQLSQSMGEAAAKATPEYQKLNERMVRLTGDLDKARKAAKALDNAFGTGAGDRGSAAERHLFTQLLLGQDIVEKAGGAEALSRTTRGIPREDRPHLGAVRDFLGVQLAAEQENINKLLESGASKSDEAFKKSTKSADNLKGAIKRVNVELKGHIGLTQQIGGLFRQFVRYGIGYAALYQVLAGARALIGGIVELDQALVSIRAITQSTNEEMQVIEGTIKRVALTTKFTTGEIAAAGQVLAQAGVSAKDFPEALTSVSLFASATESSIQTAADLISTMRNVFTELDDLQIADQLTQAVNISKLTADDLKTILSLSAQVARSYQLTSEQYLAAVTTMRNAGIKASTVATGLRQASIEIFAPDTKTLKVLAQRYAQLGEDIGAKEISDRFFSFSLEDSPLLAALTELKRLGFTGAGKATFAGRTFDVRAENAITALINNLDELVQSETKLIFGNVAVEASITQMESVANSAKNLGAALISTTHSLTEESLPAIENFIDALTSAVEGVGNFDSFLRATSGTDIGDILSTAGIGALIAGTTAAAGTPGLRVAARAATGFAVAGGVSAVSQTGISEVGGDEGITDLLGKIAGIGAVLLFFRKSIGKIFTSLKFLKGAVGGLPGLIITAGFLLLDLVPKNALNQAKSRLKAANKRSQAADAAVERIESQIDFLTPSAPGSPADQSKIAGATEKLEQSLQVTSDQIVDFFQLSGDNVEGRSSQIKDLLLRLSAEGAEAGTGVRESLIEQIQGISGVTILGNEDLESGLSDIQNAYSEDVNKLKGLFDQIKKNAERWGEDVEELEGTVQGALAESLFEATRATGLDLEVAGLAEATNDEIVTLFKEWIKQFNTIKENIPELQEAIRKAAEESALQLENFIDTIVASKTREQASRITRTQFRVPTTTGEVTQLGEAVAVINERIRVEQERGALESGLRSLFTEQSVIAISLLESSRQGILDTLSAASNGFAKQTEETINNIAGILTSVSVVLEQSGERADLKSKLDTFLKTGVPATDIFSAVQEATRAAEAEGRKFDADALARQLLGPVATGAGQTPIGTITAPVLRAGERAQTLLQRFPTQAPFRAQAFEETAAAATARKQTVELEFKITELGRSKAFDEIEPILQEKFNLALKTLELKKGFLRGKFDEAEDAAGEQEIVRQLAAVDEEKLKLIQAFLSESDSNIKAVLDRRGEELDASLKLVEQTIAELTGQPYFDSFDKLGDLNSEYEVILAEQIKLTREKGEQDKLLASEIEAQVKALEKSGAVLPRLAEAYEKLLQSTNKYTETLIGLVSGPSVETRAQANVAIRRADLGISESPADRLQEAQFELQARNEALSSNLNLLTEQLQKYEDQLKQSGLTQEQFFSGAGEAAAQAALTTKEAIDSTIDSIAELKDNIRGISRDIKGELAEGFNLDAVMSQMQETVENSVENMGENIQSIFHDSFVDLSASISDTIVEGLLGGLEGGSFQDRLHDVFKDLNIRLGKAILEPIVQSTLLKGTEALFPGSADSGSVGGSALQDLFGKQAINAGVVEVQAGVVNVNGGVSSGVGGALSGLGGGTSEESADKAGGLIDTVFDKVKGFFSNVPELFSNIGSTISNIFSGISSFLSGGGGGSGSSGGKSDLASIASLAISFFAAGKGAVIGDGRTKKRFGSGGFIRGRGTGTSDSVSGTIVDSKGRVQAGIKVSNGEAILSENAVNSLGEPFINWINDNAKSFSSGAIARSGVSFNLPKVSGSSSLNFRDGGVVGSGSSTTAGRDEINSMIREQVQSSIGQLNVTVVDERQAVDQYMSSNTAGKHVLAHIQKNSQTAKRFLR